jgi:hypothetical protein
MKCCFCCEPNHFARGAVVMSLSGASRGALEAEGEELRVNSVLFFAQKSSSIRSLSKRLVLCGLLC